MAKLQRTVRYLDKAALRGQGFIQKNICNTYNIISCEDNMTIIAEGLTQEQVDSLVFNGSTSVIDLKTNGYGD